MKTVKNPKVNLDKLIVTYQYRIKDSNKKLVKSLMHKSGLVNLVWNYCNDIQQQAVKRCRPWLSAFYLSNLTSMIGQRGRKGLGVSSWSCSKCGRHHERNQNSADNHRLAYKESLEGKTNKELKNKVSLTILDKECLQRESPSL